MIGENSREVVCLSLFNDPVVVYDIKVRILSPSDCAMKQTHEGIKYII